MSDYAEFLAGKRRIAPTLGRGIAAGDIHPVLFPFQRDLVRWSVRKGRAALFADTGLGKTLMQLEWARLLGERTLSVTPSANATPRNVLRADRSSTLPSAFDVARVSCLTIPSSPEAHSAPTIATSVQLVR